nr:hypothetical protein [uncultured Rhodopila sp.]
MPRLVMVLLLFAAGSARAADEGLAAQCARLRDDDTIHGYEPSLNAGLLYAFERLFPSAPAPPDQRAVEAGAHIRCMDGRLLACFTGANLPCEKMVQTRDNPGAAAFCRDNPDAGGVPAYAAGHDTIYSYRCVAGRPEADGTLFTLDRRGFAAELWTPLN